MHREIMRRNIIPISNGRLDMISTLMLDDRKQQPEGYASASRGYVVKNEPGTMGQPATGGLRASESNQSMISSAGSAEHYR